MIVSSTSFYPPDSDHIIIQRALKKQIGTLNDIRTLHQQAIILDRFNGVLDIPFFQKIANFFNTGDGCGAARPSCGCGC